MVGKQCCCSLAAVACCVVLPMLPTPSHASTPTLRFIDPSPHLRTYLRASSSIEQVIAENEALAVQESVVVEENVEPSQVEQELVPQAEDALVQQVDLEEELAPQPAEEEQILQDNDVELVPQAEEELVPQAEEQILSQAEDALVPQVDIEEEVAPQPDEQDQVLQDNDAELVPQAEEELLPQAEEEQIPQENDIEIVPQAEEEQVPQENDIELVPQAEDEPVQQADIEEQVPQTPDVELLPQSNEAELVQQPINVELDDLQQADADADAEAEPIILQQKNEVRIGEDCHQDDTACNYFQPTQFANNDPAFMDEISQTWGLYSIDQFCEVAHPWAVEMFGFDCAEDDNSSSSPYCRPASMQNVNLEETPYNFPSLAYWSLPKSFTFKHVRKAGGNSFLRAMWNIEGSDQPKFQVTKIRASIEDAEADRMAEERMDAIERDQQEGNVHPLFLTVRNPVSRFVSSVSQVLGDVAEVEQACWSDDTENKSDVLRCVLGLVEGGLNNIHTIPMFADIYCNVKGRNVQVSMYDLKDMAGLLSALGWEDDEKANPSKFKLSVEDLDEDMIRRICELYAWDVVMMEVAGFEVPECRFD